MLQRALIESLALGDTGQRRPPLDDRAREAAQPELDGEARTDRASADDDNVEFAGHPGVPDRTDRSVIAFMTRAAPRRAGLGGLLPALRGSRRSPGPRRRARSCACA